MTKSKLIVPKHVWDGAQAEKDKNELEKIPNPVDWRMVLFTLKLKEKTKYRYISTFICQTQDATCPILVHNRGFEGIYFIA